MLDAELERIRKQRLALILRSASPKIESRQATRGDGNMVNQLEIKTPKGESLPPIPLPSSQETYRRG